MEINTSLYKPNQSEGLPHPYLIRFYQIRLFYLYTQLDYLLASKGNGPWDKEQVEESIASIQSKLEELNYA